MAYEVEVFVEAERGDLRPVCYQRGPEGVEVRDEEGGRERKEEGGEGVREALLGEGAVCVVDA